MSSKKISKKDTNIKTKEANKIVNAPSNNLTLEDIKKAINALYNKKIQYNEIIKKEILIDNIKENIDDIFSILNIGNKSQINTKNIFMVGSFRKFIRNINYESKLCFGEESQLDDFKLKKNTYYNLNNNLFTIYNILLLKNAINSNKKTFIKKYLALLLLFRFFDKIPLNICKLILEIYINIIMDLIIINEKNISFLDSLIEALFIFLNKNQKGDKNLFNFISTIIMENFLNNHKLLSRIQKSTIFLKFLDYKSNEDKYEKNEMLINFLVSIYKNNITTNILYKEIYKNGIKDLNYYSNSLNMLSAILKEENLDNINYNTFVLKKGFYITKNKPIILESIDLNEKEISVIFSFRLFKNNIDNKDNDDIVIFNLTDYSKDEDNNSALKFALHKKGDNLYIKILSYEDVWIVKELSILKEKDYFVCISHKLNHNKKTKLVLYINDIDSNAKLSDKDKKYNEKNKGIPYHKLEGEIQLTIKETLKLKIGEKNFEGIIGDFFIINKSLEDKKEEKEEKEKNEKNEKNEKKDKNENNKEKKYNDDIANLLKLNGNYSYIADKIDARSDLINSLDNFCLNKKETINYFKKLDYKCILKLLSDSFNSDYFKANKIYDNNYVLIIDKEEQNIQTYKLRDTLSTFIAGNGIDFLVFQLHNIFSIFDLSNTTESDLDIFNFYLYTTLNLFYDILVIINGKDETDIKLKYSDEFNYIFFSFLAILHHYKEINKYLRMNLKIYKLLIEFISFCERDYYDERNLILSILLDDSLFTQNKVLKEGNMLANLDLILQHNLDEDTIEDTHLFNKEILYKILNLQFVLESKEYNHRIYMKIILSLILAKNLEINKRIFRYFFCLKNEVIIYHYLKTIYKNYKTLKEILEDKNYHNFYHNFIKKHQKTLNYSHCKYCFKLSYLIPLIQDDFAQHSLKKSHSDKAINTIESEDIPIDQIIKHIICEIKIDFITCFKITKEKKLQFVKIRDLNISNKEKDNNNIKIKTQTENKFYSTLKNLNLLKNIERKKFFGKLSSIINNIKNLYDTFAQNQSKIDESTKDLISNIFELMNFIFIEIINYPIKEKEESKKIYFNLFNQRKEMIEYFRIYSSYDYSKAMNILLPIITLSISEIKSPFYFDFFESDNTNKNETPSNNNEQKLKSDILKLIITNINIKPKNEDIVNLNKERLLIIIYKKIIKNKSISNDVEKFIIVFLQSLSIQKSPKFNYFFLIEGEYYNFFELIVNILVAFFDSNENDKYIQILTGFLLQTDKESYFYLNDMKLLKQEKKIGENNIIIKEKNIERIHVPNLLYVLYFLIYFMSLKKKYNSSDKNSKKYSLINELFETFFNNTFKLFEYINKNKLAKKFILKTNIPKLDLYVLLYNNFTSKDFKKIDLTHFEKLYDENVYKIENTNKKESVNNIKEKKSNTSLINDIKDEKNKMKEEMKLNSKDISKIKGKSEKNLIINNNLLDIDKKFDETNEIKSISSRDEIKDNSSENININNITEKKKWDLHSSLKKKNIPLIYYKKLISGKKDFSTKLLVNPKAEFFWKIFIYSLRDMIFYNKNFIKLSKSFEVFSRYYNVEKNSSEEDAFYLNYPTKIKNFICNDYYRPFLKPDIKFFNRDIIKISNKYISSKKFEKIRNKMDFTKIKFISYIPINHGDKNESHEIMCENISYRGSIFGKFYLKSSFLVFKDDQFNILEKSRIDPMFFIYSFQDITNKVKLKTKTIFFYYNDIQEVFIRRFFLKRLGYEIFLKDGRSYLFNFFNFDNFNKFNELLTKKGVTIINDPVKTFEKKDYKTKFKKGEISNFQYLLLLNKYSTRTYNDINQYLVFPLIYMDLERDIKRDLSKAVCLNKEEKFLEKNKFIDNFEILNYYFNNHYSTSAYVLYYLVRLIPYTYMQILFQSTKFDVPERIFNNYNSFASGILGSSENRELIPELFHNFELCLNLNHNHMGKLSFSNDLINNFNSNRYKTSIEFIINHRKILENTNIVPWINNIFGYNQINDSKELMNIFPLSSYEQFFDVNVKKTKEKLNIDKDFDLYQQVRLQLAILDIGITPAQLFKSAHPEKNMMNNNNDIDIILRESLVTIDSRTTFINVNINNDINNNIHLNEKKEKENEKKLSEYFYPIKKYIAKASSKKYKLFLDNKTMNLFFIYNNKITIHNIINTTKGDAFPKLDYPINISLSNSLINLELNFYDYSRNIICELMPGFYCICRNEDKTLKFINFNQQYNFSFLWINAITAVEPFESTMETKFYYNDYIWQIFFGDAEGFLCLLGFVYNYIFKNSEIKVVKAKVLKKIKIHENCINNILYYERLNIVISSSMNGDIAINNAYSLEIINMIKIGNKFLINNIKVSSYDLLYIGCYNIDKKNYYVKCYTLNGIKVTKMKTKNRIVNFFINDYINVIYENNKIDKFCIYDFKSSTQVDESDGLFKHGLYNEKPKEKYIVKKEKVLHCIYCKKVNRIIKINDNNILGLEKLV